jgi:diaminopimelate epimerase
VRHSKEMSELLFCKYHGLGNDFVIVDARAHGDLMSAAKARSLCDRNRGIGADGILTLLPSRVSNADARLHIWNADGSVAQMCGNGLRCVVAFMGGEGVVLDTDAGLRSGVGLGDQKVRVSVGVPHCDGQVLEVCVDGTCFRGLRVDMGNPHYVLNVFELGTNLRAKAEAFGAALEHHEAFVDRTNIEFLAWNKDRMSVVVHERGVGITQACGTGAGASFVALKHWGLLKGNSLSIDLLGGPLDVDQDGEEVYITGGAVEVFRGKLTLSEDV